MSLDHVKSGDSGTEETRGFMPTALKAMTWVSIQQVQRLSSFQAELFRQAQRDYVGEKVQFIDQLHSDLFVRVFDLEVKEGTVQGALERAYASLFESLKEPRADDWRPSPRITNIQYRQEPFPTELWDHPLRVFFFFSEAPTIYTQNTVTREFMMKSAIPIEEFVAEMTVRQAIEHLTRNWYK